MFDHIALKVRDLEASMAFYERALAPLGIARLMVRDGDDGHPARVGYGDERFPWFWLNRGAPVSGDLHLAFRAADRAAVDAFHGAALAAGARDNGAPGLRPHYHPGYYGAFVLDPDGVNVEAVHHTFTSGT